MTSVVVNEFGGPDVLELADSRFPTSVAARCAYASKHVADAHRRQEKGGIRGRLVLVP